jgi:VCBS repeat protein
LFVGIGDFDGDGCPDRVLIGEGVDSTFIVPLLTIDRHRSLLLLEDYQELAGRFHELQVGDLNNDGCDDLVISLGIDGTHILLSDVNGTLTLANELPVDADLYSVATLDLADFNNDGQLDLLGLVYRYEIGRGGLIMLWAGDGEGGFERVLVAPPDLITGVGDFNGDSYVDFQVLYQFQTPVVYLGNGAFEFEPIDSVLAGTPVGDLNKDGYCDSVAHLFGSIKVELGVFGIAAEVAYLASGAIELTSTWSSDSDFVIGDFNGDQWLDIVSLYGNQLSILTSNLLEFQEDWAW